MKLKSAFLLVVAAAIYFHNVCATFAQGSPSIIWEAPTPSMLANSIQGVAWSPGTSGRVAVGSTDRWVRARRAGNGTLIYSVLQPHRSGSANQTIFSSDGLYLAVHNSSGGLSYRVHRAADGLFLGTLAVSIDANGLVHFAADPQLVSAVGGDGTLSRWRIADFTVVLTLGSGYDRVTTTFNFSPNGAYQSAASRGTIKIQRRTDASVVATFAGGPPQSFAPVAFTADSTGIAVTSPIAWSPDATAFAYGTYEGTAVAARTPAP